MQNQNEISILGGMIHAGVEVGKNTKSAIWMRMRLCAHRNAKLAAPQKDEVFKHVDILSTQTFSKN